MILFIDQSKPRTLKSWQNQREILLASKCTDIRIIFVQSKTNSFSLLISNKVFVLNSTINYKVPSQVDSIQHTVYSCRLIHCTQASDVKTFRPRRRKDTSIGEHDLHNHWLVKIEAILSSGSERQEVGNSSLNSTLPCATVARHFQSTNNFVIVNFLKS